MACPRPRAFASLALVALLGLVALTAAQGDGSGPSGETSSVQAANYSCDPTACKLPACNCASVKPPGGLSPSDVPQFITFTADDAIQVYTMEVMDFFLGSRKNPNGCAPRSTYFTSLSYTNFSMVTEWYVAGNEVADHTMTHVGQPNSSEVLGNLKAINAFSGIPISAIKGFRAPFLNYSAETLTMLAQNNFTYDSSATSASPADAEGTDAFWPYTLDYGFANDCLEVEGVCNGQLKLPGFWEIPMYAIFEAENSTTPIHLMDPWLDSTDMDAVLGWLKTSFLSHYNGNRQPFGLWSHPVHLSADLPGVAAPNATRAMLNTFLDWAQSQPNTWIVSNEQLLDWVRDPVPISQLDNATYLGCKVPDIPPTTKICNGIPQNEQGLVLTCPFSEYYFGNCYGCPIAIPTPDNPVPAQNTALGVRYHLPSNCSTAFFDPIANTCLCTDATCAFTDQTLPIGSVNMTASASVSASASGAAATSSNQSTAAGARGAGMGLQMLAVGGAILAGLVSLAF